MPVECTLNGLLCVFALKKLRLICLPQQFRERLAHLGDGQRTDVLVRALQPASPRIPRAIALRITGAEQCQGGSADRGGEVPESGIIADKQRHVREQRGRFEQTRPAGEIDAGQGKTGGEDAATVRIGLAAEQHDGIEVFLAALHQFPE